MESPFNFSCPCIDIDECAAHARDVCPYLTQCINTDGSFICDCNEPGYLANGNNCVGNVSLIIIVYISPVITSARCTVNFSYTLTLKGIPTNPDKRVG